MKKEGFAANTVPAHEWRKFHKVTPLANAGAAWLGIFTALVFTFMEYLSSGRDIPLERARSAVSLNQVLFVVGLLFVVTLGIIFFSALAWKFKSFAVVESGIHLRHGVIFKQHQQSRWDRIQSVEIEQKLFGRIFGFGSVKVETAGHGEAPTNLGLLRLEDCGLLRREILIGLNNARSGRPVRAGNPAIVDEGDELTNEQKQAALLQSQMEADYPASHPNGAYQQDAAHQAGGGISAGAHSFPTPNGAPAHGNVDPGEIPVFDPDDLVNDQLIFEMPTGRFILSKIASGATVSMLSGAVFFVLLSIWLESTPVAAFIAIFGAIFNAVRSLFSQYGTKIYISENGLRVRGGLTRLTTQTIPPNRIHAINIRQPMLWRRFDWWRVKLTLAGAGGSGEDSSELVTLGIVVPVGTRDEILRVLWTIVPSLGSTNDAALLHEAMRGSGHGAYFRGAPDRTKRLDPIIWRSRGVCVTPKVLVSRQGRFARELDIVLQDHNQSLTLRQGPVQRKLGLATLNVDLVSGGSGKIKNFAHEDMEQLVWIENDLTRQARKVGVSESIEKWKRRVGVG